MEIGIWLMVLGPAIVGVTALVLGIVMLQKPQGAPVNSTARVVVGAISLVVALGVGACYGILFFGGGVV